MLLSYPESNYAPHMKNTYTPLSILALIFAFLGCAADTVPLQSADPTPPGQDGMPAAAECSPEVPEPPMDCVGATPAMNACASSKGEPVEGPKDLESSHPNWVLQDLQPQSCGFEQHYSLDTFHGTPTMVVLLWAGCGFCRGQAEKLQEMHDELTADDVSIHFVILDRAATNPPIELLTEVCGFPIFQDTEAVDAWGLHEGVKDDFYFYNAEGVLEIFIPAWGDIEMNLSTDEGYRNIKNAALMMAGRDPIDAPSPDDEMTDSME